MAKKKDNDENNLDKESKGGNRIVTIIIALVIVIIWLAVFALMIKLDVGGFGSGVLRPVLKDIPFINRILPEGTDEEYAKENNYPYKNLADAVARIKELELQLDSLTKSGEANGDYIKELESEVARLKTFEKNQSDFEQRVKEFDENVVFSDSAPSIAEYEKYYAQINPDNAAEIYRQVVEQMQYDQKVIDQANTYARMEPAAAAQILELMTAGDLDLVCGILTNMKEAQSALILANMEPATAAMITKKLTMGQ